MNIQSFTAAVSAPRDLVFNFFADIENLPRWARGYCERIALERGRWWALTADGEQVVSLSTCADAGVIDWFAGPAVERMALTPIRVVSLGPRCTLIGVTLVEVTAEGPERFARRARLLRTALQELPVRFGDGSLSQAETPPQLLELGLN